MKRQEKEWLWKQRKQRNHDSRGPIPIEGLAGKLYETLKKYPRSQIIRMLSELTTDLRRDLIFQGDSQYSFNVFVSYAALQPISKNSIMTSSRTSERCRIVIITSHLDRMGGAEKNVHDLALHLREEGYCPIVITFHGGDVSQQLEKKGLSVKIIEIQKVLSLDSFRKIAFLTSFLSNVKPDVVLTYQHDADIVGGLAAKFARVPKIISSRRDMGYQLGFSHIWFYRIFGCIFNRMITVSSAVKTAVSKREWIDSSKIEVIYNGITVPSVEGNSSRREEVRREFGIALSDIVIICVASFRSIKGQHYLVEAVSRIVNDCHGIRVLFVGYNDNDYGDSVKSLVVGNGLSEQFDFIGIRHDITNLLIASDVFVMPSIDEGFSNAVVEAMAAGLPVIAAESGGNPEAIDDGITGFLFEPENIQDLADKLAMLVKDEKLRKTLGQESQRKAETQFKLSYMLDQYTRELFSDD